MSAPRARVRLAGRVAAAAWIVAAVAAAPHGACAAERGALLLDGTRSYEHPAGAVPEWDGDSGTIEFFVAAIAEGEASDPPCVLAQAEAVPAGDAAARRARTRFRVHLSGDRKQIGFSDGGEPAMLAADFSDGEYHHVALVTRGRRTEVIVDGSSRGSLDVGYGRGRKLPFHLGSCDGESGRFVGALWSVRLWAAPLAPAALQSVAEIDGALPASNPLGKDLVAYSLFGEADAAMHATGGAAEVRLPAKKQPEAEKQALPDLSGVWVRRDSRIFEKERSEDPDQQHYRVYPVYLFEAAGEVEIEALTEYAGSEKGRNFSYPIRPDESVRVVRIRAGSFVDSIELETERNGTRRSLPVAGRRTSAPPEAFELEDGEALIGFGGTHDGMRIVSLQVYTDRRSSRSYGGEGGEPFELLLARGQKLRGLAGRIGRDLAALALVYARAVPGIELIGDDGTLERFVPEAPGRYRSEKRVLEIRGPGTLSIDGEPFELVPSYEKIEDKAAYGDPFGVGSQLYNAEFSYRSFDVSRLHPFDFKERGAARYVFHFPGEASTDYYIRNKAIIPNGVEFLALDRGGTQISTTIHTSESSYNQELSKSISLNLGVTGFGAFTRNEEYKDTINRMYAEEKTYTFGEARVLGYALVLDKARMQLDAGFKARVAELVRTRDYEDFIGAYGTHYPYAVTFGGRGILQMEMTKTTYNRLVGQDVSIKNEVNAQIRAVSAGGGSGGGESVSSSFKQEMSDQLDNFRWIGGTAGFGKEGWNVTDKVAPVYLDLRPLDELLAPPFFTDRTTVTEVRAGLRKAITEYLATAPRPSEKEVITPKERPQRFEVVIERIRVVSAGGEVDQELELSGALTAHGFRPGGRDELTSESPSVVWKADADRPLSVRAGKHKDLGQDGDGGARRVFVVPPEDISRGGYAQIRGELAEEDREVVPLLNTELSRSSEDLGKQEGPKLYWRAMRLGRPQTGRLRFRPKGCTSGCTEVQVEYRYSRIE